MQINLAKTASKNLIDLINITNGTSLTSAEISLGAPAEFVDGTGRNDRNTQVEVSAVPGSGYTDSVMVRYYRLDLDVLKGVRVLTYTKNPLYSTLETFITAVATQLEVIEDQIEIVDGEGAVLTELPILEGVAAELTVRAKADSYTYLGTTSVTLEPQSVTEPPIEYEIAEQELEGFDAPEEG